MVRVRRAGCRLSRFRRTPETPEDQAQPITAQTPPGSANQTPPLTCQVLVDRLHLALRPDEGLLDHAVLLLLQVLHLGLQLALGPRHLSLVDQDLQRGRSRQDVGARQP